MKGVVVREVSSLVLKAPSSVPTPARSKGTKATDPAPKASNINSHARYYAVVTFNQIVLSSKTQADKDVATRLVEVYFELFRGILGEGNRPAVDDEGSDALKTDANKDGKGREEKRKMREREKLRMKRKERPVDSGRGQKGHGNGLQEDTASSDTESKVISAILTGVNRALPFAGMNNDVLDKHMDTLFRITHEATFNVTIQALVLIEKVAESRPVSDRFGALFLHMLIPFCC
jgi:ribosome biogenesis protein MAK21